MSDPNDELRKRSGCVDSDDPLVSLLYSLLRDHMHPGTLEALVRQIEGGAAGLYTRFTNGWLASYAKDLADRIHACENKPDPPRDRD